jgi:hypothetical protein
MRALINGLLAVLMAIGITVVAQIPAAAAPTAPSARHKVARVCPDNGKKLVCYAIRQTDTVQPATLAPNVFPNGFGPTDLRSAYNLTATGSASMTIAVIDAWDDPNAESDLATYRSTFGLPACTTANGCFRKVNQSGQAAPLPSADAGWAGEISLDLDMVSAICPGCRILLVEAKSPTVANLGTAVNTAVNLGAKFVSNSYGGSENGSENTYDSQYYNHPGVVITASSGDNGYGVSYPASGKGVTAVGGTTLVRDTSPRGWSETAWSGAGSGCSGSVTAPAFQAGSSTGCSKRAEADVAAVADPQSGVAVYQTYGASGWSVYGGTSAAAPIIAAVYALAGNPGSADSANSYPYAHRSGLNDVTSGSNGTCGAPLCTAGAGYDGPTGLGTPIGTSAFTATSTTPPTPVTVTNPGTRTGPTGTATTLQMSASGGTAPYTWVATGLPTGLSIDTSSGLISGTPTATGTFTVTVTAKDAAAATGATTFTWTIGAAGCSSAGQKLTNPGFESGATSWTATSGVIGQPGASEPARTGTWDAWMDGYGTTHTDTLSQTVTIPTGCSTYNLSFWLHIDTQETTSTVQNDKLTVTLGASTLATYSNLNKATGYAQKTFNVAALAGQTVTLKFSATENSSRRTSFVIDDATLAVG